MEAWLLREWQTGSAWQILLRPVSWLYALVTGLRRRLYRLGFLKSEHIGVPVIVVGNITVGGTGKTPLVLALVRHLQKSGWTCGIVSRGYMRDGDNATSGAVIHVVPELPTYPGPPSAGDEAILLAERSGAPVFVSADRPAAARALRARYPGVNVIVCDDGLQHYRLHRDIEICVIDGARGLGNGALLPAGPLREPASRLAEVDAVVVNSLQAGAEPFSHHHAFSMEMGNEEFIGLHDGRAMSIAESIAAFSGKKLVAIAGTGNPSRFFQQLNKIGLVPASTKAFPDHHAYTRADLDPLDADIIVMTEKDAVKCRRFADDRMWFMRVDAILPEAFGAFIDRRLSELEK